MLNVRFEGNVWSDCWRSRTTSENRAGQELKTQVRKRDVGGVVGGQRRDEAQTSLKCREHADCSCTYQITTSGSDKHNRPRASHCPTHTDTHSQAYTHMCLGDTAVDVAIVTVLQRAAREPTAGSAVLLAPRHQYLLSSFAFSESVLPPPSSSNLAVSNFCPYATISPLVPFCFVFHWGCVWAKYHSLMFCHAQVSLQVYPDLCFTPSLSHPIGPNNTHVVFIFAFLSVVNPGDSQQSYILIL